MTYTILNAIFWGVKIHFETFKFHISKYNICILNSSIGYKNILPNFQKDSPSTALVIQI
jgi:hypothetical protein